MNYDLLDPVNYYKSTGKQTHLDNTTAYFEELLNKSKIDVEANRQTVREYNEQNEIVKNLNKEIRKYKIIKGFLIFGIIIGIMLAIASVAVFTESEVGIGVLMILVGIALTVGCIEAAHGSVCRKAVKKRYSAI